MLHENKKREIYQIILHRILDSRRDILDKIFVKRN